MREKFQLSISGIEYFVITGCTTGTIYYMYILHLTLITRKENKNKQTYKSVKLKTQLKNQIHM